MEFCFESHGINILQCRTRSGIVSAIGITSLVPTPPRFFNVLIYLRPKYLKQRQQYPEESRLWAIRRSVHGENDAQPSKCNHALSLRPNDTTDNRQKLLLDAGQARKQHPIDVEAAFNDVRNEDSPKRDQRDYVESSSPATSRALSRNDNISFITCEDLDDPSFSAEDEIVLVALQTEWRWSSGTNTRGRSKCSGGGTSSLEAISELSAVSFVDPEEKDEPLDASVSSGNSILPGEDHTYEEVTTMKSAPACSGGTRLRFLGDEDDPAPSLQKRRWSVGNATGATRMDASFIGTMFANLMSSSEDDENSSASSDGSLDPSFDRMESIKTASTRDAPVQRPTRRMSPTDLEISANAST
jgi:hypothetical protein